MADYLEKMDISARVSEYMALTASYVPMETHSWYNTGTYYSQTACIDNWASSRPAYIYATY